MRCHDRCPGRAVRLCAQRRSIADGRRVATKYAAGRVAVRSAGSAPADSLNQAVVAAMGEAGINLTAEHPKLLSRDDVEAADVVITMGCGDTCQVFPGRRCLDWSIDDPAGLSVDRVRPIRHDIDRRVRGLLADLTSSDRTG